MAPFETREPVLMTIEGDNIRILRDHCANKNRTRWHDQLKKLNLDTDGIWCITIDHDSSGEFWLCFDNLHAADTDDSPSLDKYNEYKGDTPAEAVSLAFQSVFGKS